MKNWLHRLMARNRNRNFQPAIEALEHRLVPSTYYVAPTGNKDNSGSASSPFATIQQAANIVQAGDTVIIEAGTYAGFDVQTSGTASAPITFEAAPGAKVVIDSPEANRGDCGINIEDWNNGDAMDYITIEGLDINNTSGNLNFGIRAVWNGNVNSTGIQLIDNTVTNCDEFGIFTSHEDNVLVEGNSVSGTTGTGSNGHGIYISNACFDPRIIGNTIFDNESLGLHMNGDASEGAAVEPDGTSDGNNGNIIGAVIEDNIITDNGLNGINCDGLQNSVIENNLLYNNGGGIVLYVEDAAAPATNNVIANNTVTVLATDNFGNEGRWDIQIMDGTPEDGALPEAGSTGNTVFNNILINQQSYHGAIEIGPMSLSGFHSNNNVITTSGDNGSASSHAFDLVDSSGNDNFASLATWQSDTGQDTNSLTATSAQLFVDPSWTSANGNYQLLSTSRAINGGLASFQGVSAPATDILGNLRTGSAYSIGAYQYESAVVQASTTTSLTSSAPTAQAGQSVTFTATVSSSTSGSITGTVTFIDGSTALGTATVGSNGQATFSTSSLAVGSPSITAVYSGNTSYAGSTSSALSETINQATSTTSLATSVASITAGQSVTFTATIVSSTGIAVSGTVTFKDGSTTLGTGTVGSNGQATFSTSSLAVGSHTITAVYGGNNNVSGSTSSALTQTVTQPATATSTTSLATSAATIAHGQLLMFAATVTTSTGVTATGTVTFKNGSTVLGTATLVNGIATFTTSSLSVGSHTITAVYGGSSTVTGSTSGKLTETVIKAPTTTTLKASATSISAGQSVTFTATVASTTTGTPTGTVTFKKGSTVIGTATLVNGVATFTTSALPSGKDKITAVYGGDGNDKSSTSAAVVVTVK